MLNQSLIKTEALNDCRLLLEASDEICDAFKEAVKKETHFFQMAEASQPGANSEQKLLNYCRSAWQAQTQDDRLPAKLALALSIAALRGLESQDSFRKMEENAFECSAYLYRLYYVKGDQPVQESSVRSLLKSMRQRNTIELHTFVANTAAIDEWIEQMSQWDKTFDAEINLFAEAVSGPDLLKLAPNVAGAPFYSTDDALLKLLLQLRRGEKADAQTIRSVIAKEPVSIYAQVVRNGFVQLRSVNAYFEETAV